MNTHQIDLNSPSETVPTGTDPNVTPIAIDDPALANDNQHPVAPRLHAYTGSKHTMNSKKRSNKLPLILVVILAVVLGVGTGYGIFKISTPTASTMTSDAPIAVEATGQINEGDVFGSSDEDAFPDTVTGYLEAGGIEGEGTHSLVRPGGPSQTVYMISSVTDLSKLEGMEVTVWGETYSGQKAGWLMDVGRVKVLKTAGQRPE